MLSNKGTDMKLSEWESILPEGYGMCIVRTLDGRSCKAASKYDGKVMEIGKTPRLPLSDCDVVLCRCVYTSGPLSGEIASEHLALTEEEFGLSPEEPVSAKRIGLLLWALIFILIGFFII